jgi:hypothetical protein
MFFERKTGVFASAASAKFGQGEPASPAPALAARSGLEGIFGRGCFCGCCCLLIFPVADRKTARVEKDPRLDLKVGTRLKG